MHRCTALAVVVLTLTPTALASGQRAIQLSPEVLETLPEVKVDVLQLGALSYLGSTDKWHVLGQVLTSTSRGMPFDHLETLKVAVEGNPVENGWTLRFSDAWITPNSCPKLAKVGDKLSVPKGEHVRKACGS